MTVRDQPDTAAHDDSLATSGNSSTDATHVEYPAGFEPGRIYEVVYTAKDPAVVGLGPAAIRDYISYMKQQGEVEARDRVRDLAERPLPAQVSI